MIVPREADELTSSWVTAALGRAVGGTQCRAERIGADTGYASQVYRVHLQPGEPTTVIVKLADEGSEASFYRTLGPACGPAVPRCWFAAEDAGRSVVVLDDLADAAWGDASRGCTPAQALAVVELLATIHARWWGGGGLREHAWLPVFAGAPEQLHRVVARRATFVRRYDGCLSPAARELIAALAPHHAPVIAPLGGPPATLVHRDCHLDNLAFTASGPVLFDWQRACVGVGALDLAQFLSGALRLSDRAHHEPGLIARYHATLVACGITDYALATLHADLRVALLRCYIGTINGLGGDAAATWTGRQAALTRPGVTRWNELVRDYALCKLLSERAASRA